VLYEAYFSFFIETDSVTAQTIYNVITYFTIMVLVSQIKGKGRYERGVLAGLQGYFFATCILYIVNGYIYDDFTHWIDGFNNEALPAVVFTVTTMACSVVIHSLLFSNNS
jgi:hypothetical protein